MRRERPWNCGPVRKQVIRRANSGLILPLGYWRVMRSPLCPQTVFRLGRQPVTVDLSWPAVIFHEDGFPGLVVGGEGP